MHELTTTLTEWTGARPGLYLFHCSDDAEASQLADLFGEARTAREIGEHPQPGINLCETEMGLTDLHRLAARARAAVMVRRPAHTDCAGEHFAAVHVEFSRTGLLVTENRFGMVGYIHTQAALERCRARARAVALTIVGGDRPSNDAHRKLRDYLGDCHTPGDMSEKLDITEAQGESLCVVLRGELDPYCHAARELGVPVQSGALAIGRISNGSWWRQQVVEICHSGPNETRGRILYMRGTGMKEPDSLHRWQKVEQERPPTRLSLGSFTPLSREDLASVLELFGEAG